VTAILKKTDFMVSMNDCEERVEERRQAFMAE
jgi:hypothetical protein